MDSCRSRGAPENVHSASIVLCRRSVEAHPTATIGSTTPGQSGHLAQAQWSLDTQLHCASAPSPWKHPGRRPGSDHARSIVPLPEPSVESTSPSSAAHNAQDFAGSDRQLTSGKQCSSTLFYADTDQLITGVLSISRRFDSSPGACAVCQYATTWDEFRRNAPENIRNSRLRGEKKPKTNSTNNNLSRPTLLTTLAQLPAEGTIRMIRATPPYSCILMVRVVSSFSGILLVMGTCPIGSTTECSDNAIIRCEFTNNATAIADGRLTR